MVNTLNITLCSSFRNSCGYLNRYFAQVDALDTALHERGDRLTFIWGEGDSTDATLATLKAACFRFRALVVDCTHGGPEFDSVIDAQRFRQLAHVGRSIWAAIPANADVVLWVESDLVWDSAILVALAYRLWSYPVVAPAIVLDRAGWAANTFYDTLCFRRHGINFGHRPPWHPDNDGKTPLQMDSVGSCVALRGYVARGLQFNDDTIWPDLCEQANASGNDVWFDPRLSVTHH